LAATFGGEARGRACARASYDVNDDAVELLDDVFALHAESGGDAVEDGLNLHWNTTVV
jgi:hypothetical protein